MKEKQFSVGQTVRIKRRVKEHAGKLGTVVYDGQELGWRVVKVKFDDLPRPVGFSPNEVEGC
jgi:hypothetical protein